MSSEDWIRDRLASLDKDDLRRETLAYPASGGIVHAEGRRILNFASNDYLDLAHAPQLAQAAESAMRTWGTGATASRLVVGSLPCHEDLERELARFKGYPAALLFGSGYLANLGILSALAGRGDTIFADRLAHASLVDGAILSRARLVRFRHNDASDLASRLRTRGQRGRSLIVTESVFSMDGDRAPLAELAELATDHDATLLVDEAHATGVLGPGGAGLGSASSLQGRIQLSMGTLSKALGAYGGFVACSGPMREFLVNHARTVIYTTALPPGSTAAARSALKLLADKPGLGSELQARAQAFRDALRDAGFDTGASDSQVIPLIVGDNALALEMSHALRREDIIAIAIRPPTVPAGTARLRFSVTLAHNADDLARAASTVIEVGRRLSVI